MLDVYEGSLMSAQEICQRIIKMFNHTDESRVIYQNTTEGYNKLIDITDSIVESNKTPSDVYKILKFHYHSWARDCIVLEINK
jgi:hypothetical protein